ncbi:MAG TPA: hypothetical protein VNE83_06480 [Terriglobales bacterium]|nr:hypothetical protein [Terriglobales bacterium]
MGFAPVGGFCAETASAVALGVGSVQRLAAVCWGIARDIVWAWLLPIAAAGVVAAGCWWALGTFWHSTRQWRFTEWYRQIVWWR